MSTDEIAERAAGHGGPDAFALVTLERSLMLRFAAGRPTQSTGIDDLTVEIAIPFKGHVGRASTNAVDDASLRRTAAPSSSVAHPCSCSATVQMP